MKVYLAVSFQYDETDIHGIFSTFELAKAELHRQISLRGWNLEDFTWDKEFKRYEAKDKAWLFAVCAMTVDQSSTLGRH